MPGPMQDSDVPDNNDPEAAPSQLSGWNPGERKRRFRLLIDFVPRMEGANPASLPAPPDALILLCTGREHADEIRGFLCPNPRQLFGPPIQRYAKMAKVLNLPDPNIFQFWSPTVELEATDVTTFTQPARPTRSVSDAERRGDADAGGSPGGQRSPGLSSADPSSLLDGPDGLDLDELLGVGGVLPDGEA